MGEGGLVFDGGGTGNGDGTGINGLSIGADSLSGAGAAGGAGGLYCILLRMIC